MGSAQTKEGVRKEVYFITKIGLNMINNISLYMISIYNDIFKDWFAAKYHNQYLTA